MAELITTISYGGPSSKTRNLDSAKTMCAPCGCSRQVLPTTALSYSSYCTFPLAISAGIRRISKPRLRLPKHSKFQVLKGCLQRHSRHPRCTSVQAACGGDSTVGTKEKDGCQLPTDCTGKCTARKSMQNDMENWFRFVNSHARVFLLCSGIACLVWHGRTKAAFAALLLPNVAGKTKAAWPKILQVLNVFKEQGLLLSLLLGLSAFFSMAETSITTLWPWKVRELAEKEDEGGVFQLLRKDVTRFLTTILIGTTISNIAATALVTDAATALFGEAGVTAATGVMTVVVLLLTEIAPKSIAVHNATEVARFVVRPVAWLSVILYPVGRVVTVLSTAMLKAFGLKSSGEPFVTEEELKLMLRGAELSGAIEEEEQDMIENVLEIKDTYVREVMTPLVDVVAVDAGATLLDFRNFWVKHQYSRVPVFERRIDNIVGICYAMDMLDYVDQAELLQTLTVGKIAHRPAYFVPDSMSVWNLLREFRIRKVHMAIVLNEYGGAVGIVTLEDVVEEIVGEIFDENDSKEEIRKKTGYVVQRADGVFDVDANTSIEDLAGALQVKFPEEHHYETVSGFVCEAFGYIPRTGESTKLVLRKEDPAEDHGEGDSESQDEKKEKFQIYKLEILAGNARKVGAARFEVLDTSKIKEDTSGHLPRFVRRAWGQQCEENKESEGAEGQKVAIVWDGKAIPMAKTDDDLCSTSEETEQESNLVDAEYEVTAVSTDELTVVGRPDWEENASQYGKSSEMDTDDEFDSSTANAMAYEKYLERRRQRRRRQADDASAELSRRRAELKRREAERAMLSSKKSRNEQKSSDAEKQ